MQWAFVACFEDRACDLAIDLISLYRIDRVTAQAPVAATSRNDRPPFRSFASP